MGFELGNCFCKRLFLFFLLSPGSALEKFAAIVKVEKLFFNKGLIIGQILLGKVWALNLAIAFVKGLSFFSWIQDQLWKKLLQL